MHPEEILKIIWRRRLSAFATVLLMMLGAAAVTYSLPKVYKTSALLWVGPKTAPTDDFTASQTTQVLITSYSEVLQTRNVADAVAAQLPLGMRGTEVQNAVQISPVTQSNLIEVGAEASSPARAQLIANTYARVFVQRVAGRLAPAARVNVAATAPRVSSPARPRPKLYLAIAAVLAIFAGVAIALLRERLDQRLRIEPSSTEVLGLPILARIPRLSSSMLEEILVDDGHSARGHRLTEGFRLLLANLAFSFGGRQPKTISVVSAGKEEGKSTCTVSMGRAAMEAGLNVLLVDADLRRPVLSQMLSEPGRDEPKAGLSDLLVARNSNGLRSAVVPVSGTVLSLLPAGLLPPNPPALLGSPALSSVEKQAASLFDLTIFDNAPVLVGADASLVSAELEAVILVVDVKKTRRNEALQAIDQLRRAEANLVGVVVNRAPDDGRQVSSDYYGSQSSTRRRRPLRRRDLREDEGSRKLARRA